MASIIVPAPPGNPPSISVTTIFYGPLPEKPTAASTFAYTLIPDSSNTAISVYTLAFSGPLTSAAATPSSNSVSSTITPPTTTSPTTTPTFGVSSGKSTSGSSSSTTAVPKTSPTGGCSTKQTKSGSVSSGAAAGIGIGTALIGALIGALLIWFCLKKRSGKARQHSSYGAVGRVDEEKSAGARHGIVLEDNLLERVDDSAIKRSMSDLNELIDQHTESHYLIQPVDPAADLGRRLQSCGYEKTMNQKPTILELTSTLLNPRTRFAGIRQFIGLVVISHLDLRSDPQKSLLPSQIVNFSRTIAPVERQAGAQEIFDEALLKWKAITAYLIEPSRSVKREAPKPDRADLQNAIASNVEMINMVLEPFFKTAPDRRQAQVDNLSAIIFQAAELGLLLFSQPSEWVFFWEAPSSNGPPVPRKSTSGSLVVFPGIGEKTERNGERRFRRVASPVEASI